MNTHLLLASALRTLIMGLTLFAALRLLRIHQVRAQRTAWLLALVAALAMPAFVSGNIGLHILPSLHQATSVPIDHVAAPATYRQNHAQAMFLPGRHEQMPNIVIPTEPHRPQRRWPISYAATLYALVAGFLLIRLFTGLTLAMRLRNQAERARLLPGDTFGNTDIRISRHIATPVTIADSILLPTSSAQWSEAKLRVVLSHECAHIRQHDFYIQLLASLNCAIFWFNPFSWWLQKHLSALGEAMSDHAALEQAESRVSYAEVLLEFATSAQWPLTGVAMARTSSLRIRIERLLSERLFEQSYEGRRRLPILAAAAGLIAVCASTSLVRVHAAQTSAVRSFTAASHAAQTPEGLNVTATTTSLAPGNTATVTIAPGVKDFGNTSHGTSGNGVAAMQSEPGPSSGFAGLLADPAMMEQAPALAQTLHTQNALAKTPWQSQVALQDMPPPPAPPAVPSAPPAPSYGNHSDYTYAYNNNGDSYALVSGSGSYTYSGDWNQMGSFDSIRKGVHGDFIYYRHDGKSYVIDDPAIVARAKALYAPIEALGKEQEVLGRQQEALGKQQEALGRLQSNVKIQNPDLSKETAALDKALQQMKDLQSGKEVDRESLAKLQEEIGEIQGRLGELQGEAGEQQGKFGDEQGKLGEEQGKLGEEQGRLGEKQGKLGEAAHRQIVPMIQQAIQEGKARPVN
jgi:beta-lactamase regulating signal transducer with metallopeptidase domain